MSFASTLLSVLFSVLPIVLEGQNPSRALPAEWLDDDEWHLRVQYIISRDELSAYRQLRTGAERENFIARFWARRDPTPRTVTNEFRDEFDRRVDHANANFREPDSARSGLETDRGRIYVMFGEPANIGRFPTGAYEIWRYAVGDGGTAFTFQFSVPPIHSCDGGYRILSPSPVASIKGAFTSVQVYPRGFVMIWIPVDFTAAASVFHVLQTSNGDRVPDDEAQTLNGRLGPFPLANEPLSRHVWGCRTFETGGMGFTHPLPAASYVFSSTVTFTNGDVREDSVAFEVK